MSGIIAIYTFPPFKVPSRISIHVVKEIYEVGFEAQLYRRLEESSRPSIRGTLHCTCLFILGKHNKLYWNKRKRNVKMKVEKSLGEGVGGNVYIH